MRQYERDDQKIGSLPSNNTDVRARRLLADNYVNWFLRVWGARDVRPWRFRAVFFAGLALICGTTVLVGGVPSPVFWHDIFFLLDYGWRVVYVQSPPFDFFTPLGPGTILIPRTV